jgi:hypothetical protein
VLLASAMEEGPNALHAKVAEFGMAREMQMQSKHQTRTYGTITHMAPEVLVNNIVTKARRRCALVALHSAAPCSFGTRALPACCREGALLAPRAGRRPLRPNTSARGVGVGDQGRASG